MRPTARTKLVPDPYLIDLSPLLAEVAAGTITSVEALADADEFLLLPGYSGSAVEFSPRFPEEPEIRPGIQHADRETVIRVFLIAVCIETLLSWLGGIVPT